MRRVFEWLLVILGSANAIFVVYAFAQFELSEDEAFSVLFLTPGLYFLEILAISLLIIFSVWKNNDQWLQNLWAGIGALMGIVVLGMWTIGIPLLPTLIAFSIIGVSISTRTTLSLEDGIRKGLVFLTAQIVLMIAIIWLSSIGLIND